jgi:hypothetical protein
MTSLIKFFAELAMIISICVLVLRYIGFFKFIPISERTAIILAIILAVVGFWAFGWCSIKTSTTMGVS